MGHTLPSAHTIASHGTSYHVAKKETTNYLSQRQQIRSTLSPPSPVIRFTEGIKTSHPPLRADPPDRWTIAGWHQTQFAPHQAHFQDQAPLQDSKVDQHLGKRKVGLVVAGLRIRGRMIGRGLTSRRSLRRLRPPSANVQIRVEQCKHGFTPKRNIPSIVSYISEAISGGGTRPLSNDQSHLPDHLSLPAMRLRQDWRRAAQYGMVVRHSRQDVRSGDSTPIKLPIGVLPLHQYRPVQRQTSEQTSGAGVTEHRSWVCEGRLDLAACTDWSGRCGDATWVFGFSVLSFLLLRRSLGGIRKEKRREEKSGIVQDNSKMSLVWMEQYDMKGKKRTYRRR